MNQKFILMGTVLALVSVSLPFIISSMSSGGVHYTQYIDPRILEVRDGFSIDSNMDVYSVNVDAEIPGILIRTSNHTDGFIHMDNPLPILQKLFPEKDLVSFTIISDVEIPYTLEYGKITIDVHYAPIISITGFSEI